MYQSCYTPGRSGSLEYLARNAVSYSPGIESIRFSYSYQSSSSCQVDFSNFRLSSSYNGLNSTSINKDSNHPKPTPPSYSNLFPTHTEYHFQPDNFLKPGSKSKFVGQAEEIREFIEEAFTKMFDQPFPSNIKVSVLNKENFSQISNSPGTIGLSINRGQQGLISEIFVLNDYLARVMLTFGHELGHVLTPTLTNPKDEEAKAYAFSLLWMQAVKENNIANLGSAIILENPALNGLHDVAFSFLQQSINAGKAVDEIYADLIAGSISIKMDLF